MIQSEAFQAGQLADALRAALVKTEDDFCAACRRINLLTSSGTTAITAYIQADLLVVANIGDSRAVLCRSGRALDASIDHKPGRKEERERIEALGGRVGITEEDAFRVTPRACACLWACVSAGRPLRVFPGGLSVSRTIGDISMKQPAGSALVSSEPELFETRLTAADEFLILACDGTWDVMSSAQAIDFVRGVLFRSNNDAGVASRALANEAFKRGSTDNISCVVVVFEADKPEDKNGPAAAAGKGANTTATGAAAAAAPGAAAASSANKGQPKK
jgi:protein phosphatase 2C family protein 2/3